MYELNKLNYNKIESMIDRKISSNAFLSVIDGYSPGTVFVDDLENPITALIWSKGVAGFGVAGNCFSEYFTMNFLPFVNDYLIPFLREQGHTRFEVNCVNEALNHSFSELISAKNPDKWNQNLYAYDNFNQGYHNCKCDKKAYIVNSELLESQVNTNLIKETITQYWDSLDEFFLHGIGYCCLEDNTAVSLSYTSFISDSFHEIGIETLECYRKKGYAYIASRSVLDAVISRGKVPFWECSADNIASAKTAEKLGFRKKLVYTCFGFDI